MRIVEFTNQMPNLDEVITNISDERKNNLIKIINKFNHLVSIGEKNKTQLGEFIKEHYDSI